MLGIDSAGVSSAYVLLFLSAFVCVVYGAVNWNKGAEDEASEIEEELRWEEKEKDINKDL